MSGPGDVDPEILDELRSICRGLPETVEEPAWIGIRWRVRRRTFAHVVTLDPERHPGYAPAAGADDSLCVLQFRSSPEDLPGLVGGGFPFVKAGWGTDVVNMVLNRRVDWEEVAELMTESYCVMAPKKLVALVDRPSGPP
jgi:hypothetical protein